MNDTYDVIVNEEKTLVGWNHSGKKVEVKAADIGQAILDEIHGKVVISFCKGEYPYQIKVFDLAGEEEMVFEEPRPFEFYYLKKHSSYGVSIVCTTDEPVDGRMDWQFEIDYTAGELKRAAPSH